MSMENYNYSVIIPSKNIPDLLNRAIDSIPMRDDIQLIIVDDNSDPEKVDFVHYPGLNRKNTQVVFNKDGLGAGHARNVGLHYAEGKWILFMDSDDLYSDNAFDMLDEYLNSDYDIVFWGITSVMSDDLSPCDRHLLKMGYLERLKNDKKQLGFYCRYYYTEPWGKMIKRGLIDNNNIEFEESLVANDFLFSIKTGYYATNIHYDDRILYCLTERRGSLSNKHFDSKEKTMSRLQVYYNAQLFFNSKKIAHYQFVMYRNVMLEQRSDLKESYSNFIVSNNITKWWLFKMTMLYHLERIYRHLTGKFIV